MPALSTELRSLLEKAVRQANDTAETAAAAAVRALGVEQARAFDGLSDERRKLRNALRAEARRLGDPLETADEGARGAPQLVAEVAYQHWHQMLFARFLAENDLLMHPEGVAVSLRDCEELAREEGERDLWVIATRYAAAMLPGIFRPDDPVSQLRLAPEHRLALEKLVAELPAAVFTADDSLGWVYQFWQARRKDEINRSERKIGGADIGPVTQLFTEDYMVKFLLHNTLGAWWIARHPDGLGAHGVRPSDLDYLRLNEDGTPVAGAFEGWPSTAAELKVMDPCCGSGHFLVAAFELLLAMRMAEANLSEAEAGSAVLRDNLHGLELDPRCTQIAAFALAFAAWKRGGYRELPLPHVACSGLAVGDQVEDWLAPAGDNAELRGVLRRLFHLFREAPTLGSLIDPRREVEETRGTLFEMAWEDVLPGLEAALERTAADDPVRAVLGQAARGAAQAARMLAGAYHLVCTNVPYLLRRKQAVNLQAHCAQYHAKAKDDMATSLLERALLLCAKDGSLALVTPFNWLTHTSYEALRQLLLIEHRWRFAVDLGKAAFQLMDWWAFNTALVVLDKGRPVAGGPMPTMECLRLPQSRALPDKIHGLLTGEFSAVPQSAQLNNPNARIVFGQLQSGPLLGLRAGSFKGLGTGDDPRFVRSLWEIGQLDARWIGFYTTPLPSGGWSGAHNFLLWEDGCGSLVASGNADVRNARFWHTPSVIVGLMNNLPVALSSGSPWSMNVASVVPNDQNELAAIWCFCGSPDFEREVRKLDQAVKVTNATLAKVPFDLPHWQQVAAERYPNGLPEPWSDDPTQWLFHGHPARSTAPLQVAVARLLGYRWPEHGIARSPEGRLWQDEDGLDAFADTDGIVCLPRVGAEEPAAERLREVLAAAFAEGGLTPQPPSPPGKGESSCPAGSPPSLAGKGAGGLGWSAATLDTLLAEVDCAGWTLDRWLREAFFTQHCRLFHNRPFIWQIWDGRKDGFSALVNYHKLDRAALERLTYSNLGNWITLQRAARDRGDDGADGRLVAAEQLQGKLKLILAGEPPYDIYVRWKPLHEQPLGWDPDLNDGVRMNIRPFVQAGVLRSRFTINWNKDRGKNPDGSERLNDLHLTLEEKQAARVEAGRTGGEGSP